MNSVRQSVTPNSITSKNMETASNRLIAAISQFNTQNNAIERDAPEGLSAQDKAPQNLHFIISTTKILSPLNIPTAIAVPRLGHISRGAGLGHHYLYRQVGI